MDTAALLLDSPRGRYFCANLGYLCSIDERASAYGRPQITGDVRAVLEAVDVRAIARLSEAELLDAFAHAVDLARYWQPPDEEDVMFARPEIVAVLQPIARAALASPHASWWAGPVDLGNQRCVEWLDPDRGWTDVPWVNRRADDDLERWREHALAMEAQFRRYQSADPARKIGGEWWSTPEPSGTAATTRARNEVAALELLLEEDSLEWAQARVWPIRIDGTSRVYEITKPTDWSRLVAMPGS